jgi:hypothetical protein
MIEVLPDMPEGVTGIRVSGRLRGDDLRELKPAMEELLKTGEIRIVEVVAPVYESSIIRRSSELRSCPTRTGSPTRCTPSPGWSPANSACSASTSWSGPRSGPPADSLARPTAARGFLILPRHPHHHAHQPRRRDHQRRGRHRCEDPVVMPTNNAVPHVHRKRRRRRQFQCAATSCWTCRLVPVLSVTVFPTQRA